MSRLLQPTVYDIWFSSHLAKFVGSHRLFDLAVQSAIYHNVLGGYAYAFALFTFWVKGSRSEDDASRRLVLTTLLASTVAILLTVVASALVSWPSPRNTPGLADLYPDYFYDLENVNAFPSQSTALYAVVAAGIYSRRRSLGAFLWAGVVFLVALPRMYVGGHYVSDVLAGLLLGVFGHLSTRFLLAPRCVPLAERVFESHGKLWLAGQLVVFFWIVQIAVEFRDVVWLKTSSEQLLSSIFR